MNDGVYRLLEQLTTDANREALKYQNDLLDLDSTYREQREVLLSKMAENRENYIRKLKLLKMKLENRGRNC